MRKMRLLIFSASAILIFLILGCQGVFTFAPFGGVADDPAKMPRDQLITYSWDVIASGDDAKMAAALEAVMTMATANPSDKDLWYVGANLSLTLSKAARIFTNQTEILLSNPPQSLIDFKASIDQAMLIQAGMLYIYAGSIGAQLNAVDYIFASIGFLLYPANNLTWMEGLFPYMDPINPPWTDPDVVGWPALNGPARILMDTGIGMLGGYSNQNIWWQSVAVCFFAPPV
jgi:hypothetical protein